VYVRNVEIPGADEQAAVAKILGDLDDKIDLLREMNSTLEAMVRALFRAWFVDFEPVHAKAAGAASFRGMSQELFETLPDTFEDSRVGKLPKGWTVRPLDTIADFLNGLAMQKYRPNGTEESLPVIKIAELRNGISSKTERASISIPRKYRIFDGDFIFSWSGSLLANFWTSGQGALNQHLFKVTGRDHSIWFVAPWVWHHLEGFQKIAASKATTMGHIQREHLSDAMIVRPDDEMLHRAEEILEPLFAKQIANDLEARRLINIRDTLLPKLITGEIEVPDIEALANGG
jgi:type I restriction enzyme S subunit